MQVNTNTAKHAGEFGLDWKEIRDRAAKYFTTEKVAEIGLATATVTICGLLLFWFGRALQASTVIGTAAF